MLELKADDGQGIGITFEDCKQEIGEWVLTVRLREKANRILMDEHIALAKKCAELETDLKAANKLLEEQANDRDEGDGRD